MAVCLCVTIQDQDMDGVPHTVEVTAASLSEALAPGLAATNRFAGIACGSTSLCVSRGCSCRARGQAHGFHEVVGKNLRPAKGGKRPSLYLISPRPPWWYQQR